MNNNKKPTFTRKEILDMAVKRSCEKIEKIEKDNTLAHYGVKGMEWGVRNFQRYYPRDGQQGKGVLRGEALAATKKMGLSTEGSKNRSGSAARKTNTAKSVQAARDKINDKSPSKEKEAPKATKRDYTELINSLDKEKKKTKKGGGSSKSKLTAAQKAAKEKEAAAKKAASELAKKEREAAKKIRDAEKVIRDKERAEAKVEREKQKVIRDKATAEKKAAYEIAQKEKSRS